MFLRKLAPIFLLHFIAAYIVGSEIYGFSGDPNKSLGVALVIVLLVLAHYAREGKFFGAVDEVLKACQLIAAYISGGIGFSRDYKVILASFFLLFGAVLICFVRVRRQTQRA